jgi:hypothetical protein
MYHVGHNMPGYLPEEGPACFSDLAKALEYLQAEARSEADEHVMAHDLACVESEEDSDRSCDCDEYQAYLQACGLSSAIQDHDYKVDTCWLIGAYVYWCITFEGCEPCHCGGGCDCECAGLPVIA